VLLRVNYKEAITGTYEHREVYKKQTGGRGKFADIKFFISPSDADFEPTDKNGGLQFVNEITGGNIPREFIPAVEKGFRAAMVNGVLAGYQMQTMKIRLIDGSYHNVDSIRSPLRFVPVLHSVSHCQKQNQSSSNPS
jgi:elongation factor G